jgi:hypothetical protein
LPTDDGLLLLDTSTNRLSAYNETARLVWDFLERGPPHAELEDQFAQCCGISKEIARKDIRAILEQWQSCGLIATDARNGLLRGHTVPQVARDWASEPEPDWAATFTCSIHGKIFEFLIEPERDAGIRIWFHHLETPDARPDYRLAVRKTREAESALVVNGIERMRTGTQGLLVGAIYQTILEAIHPGVEWLAMLHGGAVARNGAATILPAPSGSGKTTLIAFLLPRRFDYLADDMIALSAPDGLIMPWPLPLSIKAGSWKLLSGTYPNLDSFPQHRTQRGDARQYVPPPHVWDTGPTPVRNLVFPRYVQDAKIKLTRLTPFEGMVQLLGDHNWLGYPITEQRVRNFLAWLNDKPAYRLLHGDVAEAARCVESIM